MLSALAETVFGRVARLHGDRALHSSGRPFAGTLRVIGAPGRRPLTGAGPLGAPGEYEVIARISKSTGMPGALPDILGIALRIPVETNAVDVLFATTGTLPGARHVLKPRAFFLGGAYTTLLPYDLGGRTRLLGLFPAGRRRLPARVGGLNEAVAAAPLNFLLATASLTGPWSPCGRLGVHTPLPEDHPAAKAFDPVLNAIPGMRPTGPWLSLRRRSYDASRRGRDEALPRRDAAGRPG